nr:hypothetical protein [Tanacetum cinerariifolium]
MDTTIDQQVAIDEAFVPHARRLRIKRSNFRLLSNISSKEYTLQLVYDVLRLTPFFKAFLVTADVLKIYMQEFWATATVHHHSIREMLHICPRLPGQPFVEPPFEEKILVEHKDTKKSNEIYYLRFTKVIIHHFMSKDPLIPRRNKFDAMLPIELTNADIRNSDAYKEYYAVATGATPPKTKASVRKTKSSFDTTITPPPIAAVGPRLSILAKGKQPATTSKAKNEGTGTIPGVFDVPIEESDEEISWKSSDDDDDEEGDDDDDQEEGNKDDDDQEEKDDDDDQEEGSNDKQACDEEGNGEENLRMNVGREEGQDEEDEEDKLYRDVNINLGRGVQMADVHTTQEFEDLHVTLTSVNPDGQQQSSYVSSQFVTSMLNPTPDAGIESIFETTSQMDVQTPTLVAPLLVSAPTLTPSTIATITTTLEANFSEFMQTNQFARAVSSIPEIVQRYMDQQMNEAVKVAVQIQSDRLCDETQAKNEKFLNTIDENMQKIIKEQVKEQVNVQVSKILPKIEQTVNEQLEAEVLTRSSNSSKTSYPIILDTYEDTVTLKRRRDDDADKDEEPSTGSDRGSTGKSTQGSKSRQTSTAEEPMQITHEMEEPSHPEFETGADDQPITEPSQHPECLVELEFFLEEVYKETTDQLDWVNPEGASSRKYITSVTKTKAADYGHIKWIEDLVPRTMWIQEPESAHDVYSKCRIIAVTELKIVEWHNYKHLDWITVRRDDNKLYKFKEGDFKRLRIQDIEDMLLLLVQGTLTNLTVEERFAFNVSL